MTKHSTNDGLGEKPRHQHGNAASKTKKVSLHLAMGIAMAISLTNCRKAIDDVNTLSAIEKSVATTSAVGHDIMGTNNANNRLELFNYGDADWDASGALKWWWMPTTAEGYSSTEVSLWTNGDPEGDPMDAKRVLTNVWSGTSEVLIAVGGQLATVVKFNTTGTKGDKIWAKNCGAGSYPHGIELIPNGNVAVAASHGNWIKVFSTSTSNVATYTLNKAHSVVWDPYIHRLWVAGGTELRALIIGGTRANPTITLDGSRGRTIPGNAHDLSVDLSDPDKLWLSNSNNVYSYDKVANTITAAPGLINRSEVKSVSNNNSSTGYMVVETKVNNTACTLNDWCTPRVDFYNTAGTYLGTRTRTGAAFYKADVFAYYTAPAPAAPVANGKYKITSMLGTGKALAVQNASTASGAKVIQWTYTSTNPNDEWNVTQIGSTGYYRISNVNSGLDLNVENATYDNGDIIQYAYSSGFPDNDEWKITDLGSGQYKIESRFSGKALNVEGASTADGAQIIQYPYSNVLQSKWQFTLVP